MPKREGKAKKGREGTERVFMYPSELECSSQSKLLNATQRGRRDDAKPWDCPTSVTMHSESQKQREEMRTL